MEQTPTPLSKRGQAAQSPQTFFQSLKENSTETIRKYTWEEEEEKIAWVNFHLLPSSPVSFPLSIASSQTLPLKKIYHIQFLHGTITPEEDTIFSKDERISFFKKYILIAFYLYVCVYMHDAHSCASAWATECVWWSQGSLWEKILFSCCVGPGDQI